MAGAFKLKIRIEPPATLKKNTMLEVNNLCFAYDDKKVLDGLCFHGSADEVIGIIGENGAGKTTFFKTLMGILNPEKGVIEINGKIIAKHPRSQIYSKVTYLEQETGLVDELTGIEFLKLIFLCYDLPTSESSIRQHYYSIFKDDGILKEKISTLSGGNKRRILIAGTLLPNANLVLLDEPFTGLDANSGNHLLLFLQNYRIGKLILISSHQMEYITKLCTRLLTINLGVFSVA